MSALRFAQLGSEICTTVWTVFCIVIFSQGSFAEEAPTLFWKKKPELMRQMKEERRILVSARDHVTEAEGTKSRQEHLTVVAGGVVRRPRAEASQIIRDYGSLKQVDDRFLESVYDAKADQLFLHMAALGYHARMRLQLTTVLENGCDTLKWKVIDGSFLGMAGQVRVEDIGRQETEISMTAQYESAKLPLPSVLMGIGLEMVAQSVAAKLRSHIEKAPVTVAPTKIEAPKKPKDEPSTVGEKE